MSQINETNEIFKTFGIWLSNADGRDKERAIWPQVLELQGAKVIG